MLRPRTFCVHRVYQQTFVTPKSIWLPGDKNIVVLAKEYSKCSQDLLVLEPVCCKKGQKSPNQETGLGNRGPLEAMISN